jgi:HAE1 family hydrophobic/amphiphilic exporter-1
VYVNDFDLNTKVYRVYAQADAPFRMHTEDIGRLYVRPDTSNEEELPPMIPLAALAQVQRRTRPQVISHYNLFRSTEINAGTLPGASTGQAISKMETLARQVFPPGFNFAWSGLTLEEIESGSQTLFIFLMGVVFVYLILAAQYESLLDPFIIMMAVPIAILGALSFQMLRGLNNDVFCQIGFFMLIGLSSKNAILIVEFANQLRAQGRKTVDAVVEAAGIRLRPILMTSLAFILGILPLLLAEGPGSNSRHSLGTAVVGGMLFSSTLSLYFIPVLYVLLAGLKKRQPPAPSSPLPPAG